jgi:hypothetical protein
MIYSDEFGRLVKGASPRLPAGLSFAANRACAAFREAARGPVP